MLLFYIILNIFIILNWNIFWELNDYVLLLLVLLEMLMAAKKGEGREFKS